MARILGGNASRLEVYALFAAAVVLIGGGVAGAVVVTSSDSKPAEVAQVSVDTTVVDTTVVDTTVVDTTVVPTTRPGTEPGATTPPTTAAQRYYNPEPQAPVTSYPNQPVQTVAPQPNPGYGTYCTMPNLVGITSELSSDLDWEQPMKAAGCRIGGEGITRSYCVDPSLKQDVMSWPSYRVLSQTPSPGTLIHRTLGSYSFIAAYYVPASWGWIYGTTPCR